MLKTGGPRLRDRRAAAIRAELAAAAEALFRQRGFDEVTAQDIADAAEVSRRTLYRYFQSKDDIVFGDLAEHLDATCDEVAQQPPEISDGRAIAIAALRVAELVDDDHDVMWNRIRMIARDPRLTARGTQLHVRWQECLAKALAARQSTDVSMSHYMLASVAVSAHGNAVRFWLRDRGESSFVELTRDALAVLGLSEDG